MKIPFPQSTYVASAILGEPLGRRVVSIEVRPPTEAEKKIGGHGLTVGDIMWSFEMGDDAGGVPPRVFTVTSE